MIGDRIVYEKIHFKKRDLIVPKIIKSFYDLKNKKMIISLGGLSGTGKTEVALLVQESLWENNNIRSYVVSLDCYYKTHWIERRNIRKREGIGSVGIKEMDWEKLDILCDNFKNECFTYLYPQRIHKFINSTEECKIERGCIDIIIFEGLYANYLKAKDYGIYLEGNIKDTEKFRIKRNKEKRDTFRNKVLKKEKKEVLKTKPNANLIVPFKL